MGVETAGGGPYLVYRDGNGSCVATGQIAYHEEGQTVWVTATGPDGTQTRSNDLVWPPAG